MYAFLVEFIKSSTAQYLVAIITLVAWIVFYLVPNWSDRKRVSSAEIFDRLCIAYTDYNNNPCNDIFKIKLEYAAAKFCKTSIHAKLIDIAFKADHALSAIADVRKVSGDLKFENGFFSTRTNSGEFPSKANADAMFKSARLTYTTFSVLLIFGYSLRVVDSDFKVWSLPIITISLIFLAITFSFMMSSAKKYRLARVKKMIDNLEVSHSNQSQLNLDI